MAQVKVVEADHGRKQNTLIFGDPDRLEVSSEILALVGPNGAGKSTLHKCMGRILKPRRGCILLDGESFEKLRGEQIARRIGYIPQASRGLLPITVFDMVLLGRKPYLTWSPSETDLEKVWEALQLLGIEDLALRDFREVSGGEQQKALLARVFAQDPEVLLLDEPVANLDLRYQLEVLELLRGASKKRGISTVMAIHDLNLALRFSDKVAMLNKGEVWEIN